jgi:hypothetical protein
MSKSPNMKTWAFTLVGGGTETELEPGRFKLMVMEESAETFEEARAAVRLRLPIGAMILDHHPTPLPPIDPDL